MAVGVPAVLPNEGSFPELIDATGGGALHEPSDAESLADALEQLLLDRESLENSENRRDRAFSNATEQTGWPTKPSRFTDECSG